MQGHIPAQERPIGVSVIVLPERPIPSLGDRLVCEHLKAIPEQARGRSGEMRADAEAADIPPSSVGSACTGPLSSCQGSNTSKIAPEPI